MFDHSFNVSKSKASLRIASSFAVAFGLATVPAFAEAQEKGEPALPLKRSPLLKQRTSARLPGGLPQIKKASPGTALRAKLPGQQLKRAPGTTTKAKVSKEPQGAGIEGKSFANLKKVGPGKKCRPLPSTSKVNFDFKGDLKELVQTISETTCKNFILTNKVRSQKFEIVSPSPITVAEAWRAFLSALEANDFTLVRVGSYYKVIQSTEGVKSPVPMYEGTGQVPLQDRMVTAIWRVEHTDPTTTVNYMNIFRSKAGQIHPFPGSNVVIATDYGTQIDRLERILREIDVPGVLEQIHVVPVEYASASEIAEKLTQVFEPAKAGAKRSSTPARVKINKSKGRAARPASQPSDANDSVAVSKILADDRTNKLIIIASDEAFIQLMSLKRELDVPDTGTGDGQIHVLRLKHADAEDLASTLANLSQGRPSSPRTSRTNAATSRAKASPKAGATGAALFQGEVKITADKPTNSLVITASKSDLASVKRVVEKLDVARFQVFVEAVILEVAVKRDRTLGVGWHGGVPVNIANEQNPILFGNTPNSELSSLTTSLSPLNLAGLLGLVGGFRGPTLEGTENIVNGGIPSIGAVIQALQSTNNVNIVSTPHLLTMDNEEAQIEVNEKRPFPSGLNLGGLGGLAGLAGGAAGGAAGGLGGLGGLGLGSVSFNREDVGLTLKLKPQINDADYVRLEIDQELSDVAGIDQVTQQVITSKRAAKTVVVVRSQDSIVIGGLVRDRETLDESKTPLFGDIPLIGWLFKRQQKVVEKVNLVLVITPYIIRGPEDFRVIFERKMRERKEFLNRFYGATAEYRATIDWRRKIGPLAKYRSKIRAEMQRAENDGPGSSDEEIIRPIGDAPPSSEGTIIGPNTGLDDVDMPGLPEGSEPSEPSGDETPPVPEQ